MHQNLEDGFKNSAQVLAQPNIWLGNDGHKPKQQFLIQPNIGLDKEVRLPVIDILNHCLADEAVLSQKTRSAHWNVRGTGFFELYILFETQYKQLNEITDQVAERVRMLGGLAIASFEKILSNTRIEEQPADVLEVLHLLADHETIIRFLREDIRQCGEEYEDEGTIELLVSVLSMHEKMAWMLRAYIENEPVKSESLERINQDV
jgi:starvation-inducible DNA-binding protein